MEVLAGPERRRRWSVEEKLAVISESFAPSKTISMVVSQHGVNPNQVLLWCKLYQDGGLWVVNAGEEVVSASELAEALKQLRKLQRMLGKRTMGNEILREAVEYGRAKLDSALAIVARGRPVKQVCEALGVARSNVAAKRARPADWHDGRTARQTDDAGLVSEIRHVAAELRRPAQLGALSEVGEHAERWLITTKRFPMTASMGSRLSNAAFTTTPDTSNLAWP